MKIGSEFWLDFKMLCGDSGMYDKRPDSYWEVMEYDIWLVLHF